MQLHHKADRVIYLAASNAYFRGFVRSGNEARRRKQELEDLIPSSALLAPLVAMPDLFVKEVLTRMDVAGRARLATVARGCRAGTYT